MIDITCSRDDFLTLRQGLVDAGYDTFVTDEVTKLPQTSKEVTPSEAQRNMKLLDYFEDHDDIENVYSNLDIDDETAAALDA